MLNLYEIIYFIINAYVMKEIYFLMSFLVIMIVYVTMIVYFMTSF